VRPTAENAERVWNALAVFGTPHRDFTVEDFSTPDTVFQIGLAPNRIDILTSIDGVSFDEAWLRRQERVVDDQIFYIIARDDLLKNKKASGRPKDLIDAAWLEESQ